MQGKFYCAERIKAIHWNTEIRKDIVFERLRQPRAELWTVERAGVASESGWMPDENELKYYILPYLKPNYTITPL